MSKKHDSKNPIIHNNPNIIQCWTDGSSKSMQTDSPYGGWGCYLINGEKTKELFGGEDITTNNRMEITAVIKGLEAINIKCGKDVEVYSDSAYVINCITANPPWHIKWQSNGWINSKKEKVLNKDLWINLVSILSKFEKANIKVDFLKVKSHIGIERNEIADELANKGANLILEERIRNNSNI